MKLLNPMPANTIGVLIKKGPETSNDGYFEFSTIPTKTNRGLQKLEGWLGTWDGLCSSAQGVYVVGGDGVTLSKAEDEDAISSWLSSDHSDKSPWALPVLR